MLLIYGKGERSISADYERKRRKPPKQSDFSVPFNLFNIPEIHHSIARKTELVELRRSLTADGSRRVVVIQGLQVIGKTQLAVVYAEQYREHYSAVFWLNIKDHVWVKQRFVDGARQILGTTTRSSMPPRLG
ncbi:hypothetical protein BKA67DRAFT_542345 [Truncatella angustata]|uniref:NB-ARC domain-containing protein n=1 Tax=Truncatella angustata TaxID=152316 RepID=A0A9P8RFC2_9PEZI|nr:uncharacterized protein BKA67DRAFT_542345 [Truncatella angustata]KAH6643388.1 hypothetical protein BKA67DRAFT_542345 [Truncatella angustata]